MKKPESVHDRRARCAVYIGMLDNLFNENKVNFSDISYTLVAYLGAMYSGNSIPYEDYEKLLNLAKVEFKSMFEMKK